MTDQSARDGGGPLQAVKRVLRPLRSRVELTRYKLAGRAFDRLGGNLDHGTHVAAAMAWLERAQDAGTDRGVSYGADLGGGFQESYPETTGYIIPTFLAAGAQFDRADWVQRAVEMGDWEIAVQMPSGAVMGGKLNSNPTPAIFNTGQVLLGWSALYRTTSEARFLSAAERAARWMIEVQNADGGWTKGNSEFASKSSTLYNVKAAWGLCEAGYAGVGEGAIAAARRNADLCLSRQHANGWYPDCCLLYPEKPLLHTIAYAMQGLIGIGRLTGEASYIAGAERTARSLVRLMDADGTIPGQIDARFERAADYACLTGSAQTSIVWSELYALTGDAVFREARMRVNRNLMARHNLTQDNPAVRGGVYGSWPVWGEYGRLKVLNWATKFFVDAIMLEMQQEKMSGTLPPAP